MQHGKPKATQSGSRDRQYPGLRHFAALVDEIIEG